MNREHPFGMPIWKPALYRKSRSVVRKANLALHSYPSSSPRLYLHPGNILWTLIFGWWLALVMGVIALLVWIIPPDGRKYSAVTGGLAMYLLWPFGRYVERIVPEEDAEAEPLISTTAAHYRKQTWKELLVHVAKSGLSGWVYYLFYLVVIGTVYQKIIKIIILIRECRSFALYCIDHLLDVRYHHSHVQAQL